MFLFVSQMGTLILNWAAPFIYQARKQKQNFTLGV